MVSVQELIKAHPKLVESLGPFDLLSASRLIGATGSMPCLHLNTLRIEILAHIAFASCRGDRSATPDDLESWLSLLAESPAARFEDPTEDLFINCVTTEWGSFRLFQGIFADAGFLVEQFISFYTGKESFPTFEDSLKSALAMARLSDALAGRLSLPRYLAAGGEPKDQIIAPEREVIFKHADAVVFSAPDLESLGIDLDALEPFTTRLSADASEGETFWDTSLDRSPLLADGTSIVVLIPSALARAIVKWLLKRVAIMGRWGEIFFHQDAATRFINDVAARMQIHSVQSPPKLEAEHLPPLLPAVGWFDVGKPVIMLTHMASLRGSLSDIDRFTPEAENAIEGYLDRLIAHLTTVEKATGGLVLLCMVGVGRTSILFKPRTPENWTVYMATLREWEAITVAGHCPAMRLWKLSQHLERARQLKVDIANTGDALPNLLSFWITQGYRLVPRQMDLGLERKRVVFDCGFSHRCFLEDAEARDEHAVLGPGGSEWIRVVRHHQAPLFPTDSSRSLYEDQRSVWKRILRGCSLAGGSPWWVIGPDAPKSENNLSLILHLWRCVLEWVDRIVPHVNSEWPALCDLSICIRLELPGIDHWSVEDKERRPTIPKEVGLKVEAAKRELTLVLEEGFLWRFNEPKNTAERLIVSTIVAGAVLVAGCRSAESTIENIVDRIVGSDGARFFHLTTTFDLEPVLLSSPMAKPLFVLPEDMAFIQLGLADAVGRPAEGTVITTKEDCLKFLHNVVTQLWERIEVRLARFNHKSVVSSCLGAIDSVSRDQAHWDMTMRSLLALHSEQTEARKVIEQRRSDCQQATLVNRLLIETSQYACRENVEISFNQDDHTLAMAEMSSLLLFAAARDAIDYGFAKPELMIHPNGEIETDANFNESVVIRYMSKKAGEHIDEAAARYEKHFPDSLEADKPEPFRWPWEPCFEAEYGFSIDDWANFQMSLREFALTSGRTFGFLEEDVLVRVLEAIGMSTDASQSFITRLSLPFRSGWNTDLPPKCSKQDVYPWRFRRNLSLLTRPMIQVSKNPCEWALSVPLMEKSMAYLLHNINEARFPESFFMTAAMRKHIGDTTNSLGHLFAKKVEKVFAESGYATRLEVKMRELGVPKQSDIGDVDVLAWLPGASKVFAVECKRLVTALSMREILQRLEDFKGDPKAKDALAKHIQRMRWLKTNPQKLAALIGVPSNRLDVVPLIVTSGTVPMQFFDSFSQEGGAIIAFFDLRKTLRQEL